MERLGADAWSYAWQEGRDATRCHSVAPHIAIPRRARKEERKNSEEVQPWNVQEVQKFIHGIKEDRLYAALLLFADGAPSS